MKSIQTCFCRIIDGSAVSLRVSKCRCLVLFMNLLLLSCRWAEVDHSEYEGKTWIEIQQPNKTKDIWSKNQPCDREVRECFHDTRSSDWHDPLKSTEVIKAWISSDVKYSSVFSSIVCRLPQTYRWDDLHRGGGVWCVCGGVHTHTSFVHRPCWIYRLSAEFTSGLCDYLKKHFV